MNSVLDYAERSSAGASPHRGQLTAWAEIRAFVFAGNARFTLVSAKTGDRFTYRVKKAKEPNPSGFTPFFVSLLRGPDNTADYAYMGIVDERGFHPTARSRVGPEAASHKAFQFLLARMATGGEPCRTMEFWHDGKCCRCGRDLTVPSSVKDGIGPECRTHLDSASLVVPRSERRAVRSYSGNARPVRFLEDEYERERDQDFEALHNYGWGH